jgi:hypothetical protein
MAILGLVDLVGVLTPEEAIRKFPVQAAHITGPWCWVLLRPRRLPNPIPMRGRLGLWPCPLDLI